MGATPPALTKSHVDPGIVDFFCFIPDTKHLRIERALSLQIVLYSDRSGEKQVEERDAAGTVRSQSVQQTILGG